MPEPTLLDVQGAARTLGVTTSMIRRLVLEKRIPYFKIGRYVRFDLDDLERFKQAHKVPAAHGY